MLRLRKDYKHIHNFPKAISPAECVYVPMGGYAIIDMEKNHPHLPRMMASTDYNECVGILACVKNAHGKPIKWGLAHITIDNDSEQTIRKMDRELRAGNNGLLIECDIFGGNEDYDIKKERGFQSGKELIEIAMETASALPNSVVRDLTPDDSYAEGVLVDLAKGQKYAGIIDGYTQADITKRIQHYVEEGSNFSQYKRKLDTDISAAQADKALVPALRMDWEKFMPEMTRIWNTKNQKIMSDIRDDVSWNRSLK